MHEDRRKRCELVERAACSCLVFSLSSLRFAATITLLVDTCEHCRFRGQAGHDRFLFTKPTTMKRPRATLNEGSDGGSGSDNDAFDDGDDLMARAASMMDFDDEEDESDSDEDSEASTSEAGPSTGKKQKLNGGGHKGKRKDDSDALPDDEEAELQSVLQLKVRRRDRSHIFAGCREQLEERARLIGLHLNAQIDALLASVRCPDPSSSKAQPLNNFIQRIR